MCENANADSASDTTSEKAAAIVVVLSSSGVLFKSFNNFDSRHVLCCNFNETAFSNTDKGMPMMRMQLCVLDAGSTKMSSMTRYK